VGRDSQQRGCPQGDVALSEQWFPRPRAPNDILLIVPSRGISAERLCALLNDPEATEWRDRVGVVGRVDGSAKPSTRLLASRGWVAKTRVDLGRASKEDVYAEVVHARAAGLRAELWHPHKQWAIYRSGDLWYPLTLCPELVTLRRLEPLGERMAAWTKMASFALATASKHGVGLDLNPANFAHEVSGGRLYYLDEELYPELREDQFAGALVSRIPEEPDAGVEVWAAWGTRLRTELEERSNWTRICEEAMRYPVTSRFEANRDALVAAMRPRPAPPSSSTAPRDAELGFAGARLTCVISDVHANLPALDAVLRAASDAGADSYLFLGDVVGYGPYPAECIERLRALPRAVLLRGNHDHAISSGELDFGMNSLARTVARWTRERLQSEHLSWLGSLRVEYSEPEWLAVHGAPKDPARLFAYVYELTYEDNLAHLKREGVPLCFCGHTHVPMVYAELDAMPVKLARPQTLERSFGRPLLINPGSVGQPRDGDPRASFALWDRQSGRVDFRRIAYDIEVTTSALRAAGLPEELERRLHTGL
jgi:diadenosine tetraphosphatase ApaH/serine/threonine PP2A family protein phosphatase